MPCCWPPARCPRATSWRAVRRSRGSGWPGADGALGAADARRRHHRLRRRDQRRSRADAAASAGARARVRAGALAGGRSGCRRCPAGARWPTCSRRSGPLACAAVRNSRSRCTAACGREAGRHAHDPSRHAGRHLRDLRDRRLAGRARHVHRPAAAADHRGPGARRAGARGGGRSAGTSAAGSPAARSAKPLAPIAVARLVALAKASSAAAAALGGLAGGYLIYVLARAGQDGSGQGRQGRRRDAGGCARAGGRRAVPGALLPGARSRPTTPTTTTAAAARHVAMALLAGQRGPGCARPTRIRQDARAGHRGRTEGGQPMITGMHAIITPATRTQARAFFRDVLGLPHVDAHDGWLIFQLPPSELGSCIPEDRAHRAARALPDVRRPRRRPWPSSRPGARSSPHRSLQAGFGLLTSIRIPGGGEIGLYQPRHRTAYDL